jgi:hypothetical protein
LGGALLKLEALRRSGQGGTFSAAVAGFEYTLVGLFDSIYDLGVIGEYLYDDRGGAASTPFEDDVFVGGRLTFNDAASSAILAGGIFDREGDGTALTVEASRRWRDRYTLSLEIRSITDTEESDLLHALRADDYLQFELQRFF